MMLPKSPVFPRFISSIGTIALPQPFAGSLAGDPIKTVENIWLEIQDGKIKRIGPEGEPTPPTDLLVSLSSVSEVFDARGMLATPGLIDPHTHPVFVDTRQGEFVRRCRGESYQQIAASGGGILSSIRGVRTASIDDLVELIRKRLDSFLHAGTTFIEAKSGYGLTLEDELKSLRALRIAAVNHSVGISPTLLAAHVVPPEFLNDPDGYVDLVCESIIPQVVEEQLAEAVDVFLEEGAFNSSQTRRIFKVATETGLACRLHADQFNRGEGAEIAVEFNALSVDHMDRTDGHGIEILADKGITVVLLPGAVFFLGFDTYASAREMIEEGCKIAISTDFNPGSTPTQSLPLMMTLACIKMRLTPVEALWAATMGGAYAVNRSDCLGSLLPGYNADICLWDAEDVAYLPYAYGNMMPEVVFKRGRIVAQRGT